MSYLRVWKTHWFVI